MSATTERLRDQCLACPWRDMAMMRSEHPTTVAAARTDAGGFVCHTRCGPCDGPRIARRKGEL